MDPLDPRLRKVGRLMGQAPLVHREKLRVALEALPSNDPPRARLLLFGAVEPSEVDGYTFEPEVFPAMRLLGRNMNSVYLLAAVVLFYALQYVGIIPRLPIPLLQSFGMPVMMGMIFLIMLLWRGLFRPTYVRVAPGVVEFLCYRWFWYRRAEVCRYPIEAGATIVICEWISYKSLRGGGKWDEKSGRWQPSGRWSAERSTTIGFFRGERHDTIHLGSALRPREILDVLWKAIFSTATAPVMSDEELLG